MDAIEINPKEFFMAATPTTLVVGANGTVGSELSRLLAARGHRVLRAGRKRTRADDVQLDLVTGAGADHALEGVDRAFLLAPPGHVNQDELLAPLIDAARTKRLKKVVLMTAMGADASDDLPLRKAELALIGSGVTWNVIRPNWFMQNFQTFWLHGIQTQNKILLPVGAAKGSFIDARDIAATAAQLLSHGDFDQQAFDLTGPRALDHDEVAAILSRVAGRTVTYEDITPDAMRAGLLQGGVPAPYAEFMITILGYFKAGYAQRTTDAVQRITGHAPRSIEQYVQDHRQAWIV
ncbi:MAG TPA: NAD(P)H-binding protein [Burkholderiaceae bacterium]|nr:NAD(P)H-binding protein [Burkholderiaceae bacterium]